MKKAISITISVLYILVMIVCILSMAFFAYLKWLAPDKLTELVTHMNPLETTDGRVCVIQTSLYENTDGTGEEVFDVKISGYTDTTAKEITSFGVQVIGGVDKLVKTDAYRVSKTGFLGVPTEVEHYSSVFSKSNANKLSFYTTTDNLTYKNVDKEFDDFGYIRLNVNDKIYAFSFGAKQQEISKILWETDIQVSSLSNLILNLYEKTKTTPVGRFSRTFEFQNMFKALEFKNNKYEDVSNQDAIFNYCYIDVNHYTTGAKTASDSLFGQIKYDNNWTIDGASLLDGHFADKSTYYLTEKDCKFIYDETTNKHYFDLTDNCYNFYKDKKLNYKLVLDLDYLQSINVAFGGVKESNRLSQLGITKYFTKSGKDITEVDL